MTESQTKVCQNCKNQFTIEPDDFTFYEKLQVPPPTWCPECRLRRQLIFRNERILYHRKCDAPGHTESFISIYSPDKRLKVCDQEYWWSDKWDPRDFGLAYDFSTPFFTQFSKLFSDVYWPNLVNSNGKNSEYCHTVINLKDCYLVFGAGDSEGILYSNEVDYGKNSMDLSYSISNELCYQNMFCNRCYKVYFSLYSHDSSESSFLYDCNGCTNCLGCVGLRNKSYHIFNKPHSKEDYFEEMKKYDFASYSAVRSTREAFNGFRLKFPYKYAHLFKTADSTGDNLWFTKNAKHCFDSVGKGMEDSKYVTLTFQNPVKDIQSCYSIGHNASLVYDSISILTANNTIFSKKVWTGNDINYSYNCHSCNNLFGCIGLRNKQYCILNKQYPKEEYESLVPRIIKHMNDMPYIDKKGRVYRYGEFFPPDLSPFAYNETIAQEYFPLTKDQALAQGYRWKDPDTKEYTITKPPSSLPDHIRDVKDDITEETIGCAHANLRTSDVLRLAPTCPHQCTTAFRIIPEELSFYRRMNLPLPRLCPNCRHYERLAQRNPLKLWHRRCQCAGGASENGVYGNTVTHQHQDNHCPNEFETSYAPERKEIVYCESCYNAEVV